MTHKSSPAPVGGGLVPCFRRRAAFLARLLITLLMLDAAALSQPRRQPFQPGVQIDWQARAVAVSGRVVLREGSLEFFACLPGKEHESIVRLDASAAHIYQALGLIGLEPGAPPRWDADGGGYEPAQGALVDITVEWHAGNEQRTALPSEWLREIDTLRQPLARPWLFAGSIVRGDHQLEADITGAGVALVDHPDALLSQSQRHSNSDAQLWVQADTQHIPALETSVTLVFVSATPPQYELTIDWRGCWRADGRFVSTPTVADLIGLMRRARPDESVIIRTQTVFDTDLRRAQRDLQEFEIPASAVRFETTSQPAPP